MKFLLLFFLGFYSINNLAYSQVTFSEHISPIIYKNCTSCHRQGEIGYEKGGPFTSYTEVANKAQMIKFMTQTKQMPPWPADNSYSKLVGTHSLTQEQIDLIANWVDGGMQQGDPMKEAQVPSFPQQSQLGIPDLVIKMQQSYTHIGDNNDEYRVFVINTNFSEDKYISQIEFRAGNKSIVHHCLLAIDTTKKARQYDANDAGYGYADNLGSFGFPSPKYPNAFAGYAPGANPIVYPSGIYHRLPKGADMLLQVHYAPTSIDGDDLTSVNIFFSKDSPERSMNNFLFYPFNGTISPSFDIPANEVVEFHDKYTFTKDQTLFAAWPHMHLLGQTWKVFAVTPQNDTFNIVRINKWDFKWQNNYFLQKPLVLKKGTVVHAYASYDNTSNNPLNPYNPPIDQGWGLGTKAEMFYLPIYFANYKAGDENLELSIDDEKQVPYYNNYNLSIYPIPATDKLNIEFDVNSTASLELNLKSIDGKQIENISRNKSFPYGRNKIEYNASKVSSGEYLLEVKNSEFSKFSKIIINK